MHGHVPEEWEEEYKEAVEKAAAASGGTYSVGGGKKKAVTTADAGDEPTDEEDQPDIGSKSYSSTSGRGDENQCIHCGDRFTLDGVYHGYYCEDCREPEGFREDYS